MTPREERRGAGRPSEIGLPKEIQLTPYQQTLDDAGISEKTAHTWQKVMRNDRYRSKVGINVAAIQIRGRKDYQGYLKSPHWRALRKRALERDGWACRVCNRLADDFCRLDVHHRSYDRLGEPDEIKDLLTMCEYCHDLYHGSKREKNGNGKRSKN